MTDFILKIKEKIEKNKEENIKVISAVEKILKQYEDFINSKNIVYYNDVDKFLIYKKELIKLINQKNIFNTFSVIHIIKLFYLKYKLETINDNNFILKIRNINNLYGKKRIDKVKEKIGLVEGRNLDEQQLFCISKCNKNNLIIAGAGTGKTTTIIGFVKDLLLENKCNPEEILVLSFTNDSASEMKDRLCKETDLNIDAMTFHKLGLDIITEVEKLRPKICDLNLFDFIKNNVDILIKDQEYLKKLNEYLISSRIDFKNDFDFSDYFEYKKYIEENSPISLKGEILKSFSEVHLANFLFLNGINYEYETSYRYDTRTMENSEYKPDFYLPDYDIYIEMFGIDKNGNVPSWFKSKDNETPTETYQKSMKWKRDTHAKYNTKLIECYSYEVLEGVLEENLKNKLNSMGILFNRLEEAEIFDLINKSDENVSFEMFYNLINNVINIMKSKNLDIDGLYKLNNEKGYSNKKFNQLIIDLIEPIYNEYQNYLNEKDCIDFNDMINKATDYISKNKFIHNYKYVIIDEYQDISEVRYLLIKAMRKNKDFNLFCVGDDWQSIYRFNGSNIDYILNFEDYWGLSEINKIETTYRFKKELIDISGKFVMNNPKQIKKEIKSKNDDDTSAIELILYNSNIEFVNKISDKLKSLPLNSTVFFVGRYSYDLRIIDNGYNYCSKFKVSKSVNLSERTIIFEERKDLKIEFITAHKSKGLEADYVFIINNKNDRMGFPSKIKDSSIIDLLLSTSDNFNFSEERRLFYVALTRSREKTYLLSPNDNRSSFVNELMLNHEGLVDYKICPLCYGKLVLRENRNGHKFYGCSNFSKLGCKYTEDYFN